MIKARSSPSASIVNRLTVDLKVEMTFHSKQRRIGDHLRDKLQMYRTDLICWSVIYSLILDPRCNK